MQNILQRGIDFSLNQFSKEEIHVNLQESLSMLHIAGSQWKELINSFVMRMKGKFIYLFDSKIKDTESIWNFFITLSVNIKEDLNIELLNELRLNFLFQFFII